METIEKFSRDKLISGMLPPVGKTYLNANGEECKFDHQRNMLDMRGLTKFTAKMNNIYEKLAEIGMGQIMGADFLEAVRLDSNTKFVEDKFLEAAEMQIKRGFVLLKSEKQRIRNLYQKNYNELHPLIKEAGSIMMPKIPISNFLINEKNRIIKLSDQAEKMILEQNLIPLHKEAVKVSEELQAALDKLNNVLQHNCFSVYINRFRGFAESIVFDDGKTISKDMVDTLVKRAKS